MSKPHAPSAEEFLVATHKVAQRLANSALALPPPARERFLQDYFRSLEEQAAEINVVNGPLIIQYLSEEVRRRMSN